MNIRKFFSILFAIIFVLSTNIPVFAQEENIPSQAPTDSLSDYQLEVTPSSPPPTPTLSEFDRQYIGKLTGLVSILHITSCIIVGEKCLGNNVPTDPSKVQVPPQLAKLRPYYRNGLLGLTSNIIAFTYANPPASFGYSLTQFFAKLTPVQSAYAQNQGIGVSSLSAFANFWSVNRNIAYSFITLLLVIVGLLLIFRFKIDPQTSIDLEKSIMRIVFVLLAITFSFAIAGLLVDLMYMLIFGISYLAKTNNLLPSPTIDNIFTHANPDTLFNFLFTHGNPGGVASSLKGMIPESLMIPINTFLTLIMMTQMAPFLANTVADAIQTPVASLIGLVIGGGAGFLLTPLIVDWLIWWFLNAFITLALLFLYFRILFTLLSSYVEVVIGTIFAPYFLMMDIIPGKSHFTSWMKRYIANIIVFPLLFVLLITGAILSGSIATSGTEFLPPPLLTFNQTVMSNILAIGILISIPSILDRVKHAIHPQPMLVNFPQTPAAIVSTAAALLPFVPHVISSVVGGGAGVGDAARSRIVKKRGGVPGASTDGGGNSSPVPKLPNIPQMPGS